MIVQPISIASAEVADALERHAIHPPDGAWYSHDGQDVQLHDSDPEAGDAALIGGVICLADCPGLTAAEAVAFVHGAADAADGLGAVSWVGVLDDGDWMVTARDAAGVQLGVWSIAAGTAPGAPVVVI